MGNEVMEKVIQLAMENAELKTRIDILHNKWREQEQYAKEHGYGGSIYTTEIANIMGWSDECAG